MLTGSTQGWLAAWIGSANSISGKLEANLSHHLRCQGSGLRPRLSILQMVWHLSVRASPRRCQDSLEFVSIYGQQLAVSLGWELVRHSYRRAGIRQLATVPGSFLPANTSYRVAEMQWPGCLTGIVARAKRFEIPLSVRLGCCRKKDSEGPPADQPYSRTTSLSISPSEQTVIPRHIHVSHVSRACISDIRSRRGSEENRNECVEWVALPHIQKKMPIQPCIITQPDAIFSAPRA